MQRRPLFGPSLATAGLLALFLSSASLAQDFVYTAEDVTAPAGSLTFVGIILDSAAAGECGGFTTSVCHPAGDLSVIEINPGSATAGMNGGSGPEFLQTEVLSNGITASAVFGLTVTLNLPAADGQEIWAVTYSVAASPAPGTVLPLTFCDNGNPIVTNLVANAAAAMVPIQNDGSITVTAVQGPPEFIRGDTNGDGQVSITDALILFSEIFGSTATSVCPRSGDVNADDQRDISDVISLLEALLGNGPPIPAPYPDCGTAPASLLCTSLSNCP